MRSFVLQLAAVICLVIAIGCYCGVARSNGDAWLAGGLLAWILSGMTFNLPRA